MGIKDWDTDTSGENVMMLPLTNFALLAADATIGLKLDHFKESDHDGIPSGRLQLILTAQQAHDLGRALQSASQIVQAKPLSRSGHDDGLAQWLPPAGKLS